MDRPAFVYVTYIATTPEKLRGYAHPELIAETDWLAANLDSPKLRIVDARAPQQYSVSHIPGAVSLDGFGSGIPRAANGDMGDPPRLFNRLAGDLGISNDLTVVVYDTPSQRMGMVAWAFLYYGHGSVRMLDGGFDKWSREGRAISNEVNSYPFASYKAKPLEGVYCSLSQARASQTRSKFVFWDTRSLAEYEGTASSAAGPLPRPGHIPGAVHLEWSELFDRDTKTLKDAAELRRLLEARGITPDVEVASY